MSANFTPSLDGYQSVGNFRFWCQKVLPLVYDDSLSYYELLCKVVDYLNKLIDNDNAEQNNIKALLDAYNELQDYVNHYFDNLDVQEEINNKLDSMVADGTIMTLFTSSLVPYVMPEWYGAIGDGITDDYIAFSKMIEKLYDNGGGVIQLSGKKYLLNECILIPSNVTIYGNMSTLKTNNSQNISSGVILMVCGDNVTIKDLSFEYNGWDSPTITGSQFGAMSIINGKYEKNISYPNTFEDRKNVFIHNITTNKYYLSQVESKDGYNIDNIHFYSCKSNSLMSIQPAENSLFTNVSINKCECGYIRLGTGSGDAENLNVNECGFQMIRTTLKCTIDKCYSISDSNSEWIKRKISNISVDINNDTIINNCILNGNNLLNYGIMINGNCNILNTISNNYLIRNINQNETSYKVNALNCDFTGNNSLFYGRGYNTQINKVSENQKTFIDKKLPLTLLPVANVSATNSFLNDNYIYGNTVHLNIGLTGTPESDTIATLSNFHPDKKLYFTGIGYIDTSNVVPITLSIDVDGSIKYNSYNKTVLSFYANFSYTVD